MKDFFKLLQRFAWPYRWNVVLGILFSFLTALLTLFSFAFIIPILQMLFGIDTTVYEFMPWGAASPKEVVVNNFYWYVSVIVSRYGASFALAALAASLVIMTMLKTGSDYLSNYFVIPLRNGVVRDMRRRMYDKILSLPIGFFTGERKGDVIARISGDVQEIQASVMASINTLFKNPIMIIVCLAMMIVVSWQLTIFVLVLLPIAGAVMGGVGKRLKRKSLEAQNLWGRILSTTEETLGGLRIIKAFNAEKKMQARFNTETGRFFSMSNAIDRRQSAAHPMSELLGTAAIAIVLWFGGTLILSGHSHIDAAAFIYYMVIFYSVINPAKDLSKASYAVRKGMASMERIDRILSAEDPIKDPKSPTEIHRSENGADIRFENVSFHYEPGRNVLSNINLEIPAGKTVAIVGHSGSGKSTLADLIPRFYDVSKGRITINGTDIRNVRVHDLRTLMGNVNQEAILFNDTFRANIAFGVENATDEQIRRAAEIANAHDFIMESPEGYDTVIGDRGCKLSGGQRQRISIARAVLKNPPILILDEATSALDTESEHLVQQALDRLMKDRTTIVIAHRLSTITGADLICVIDDGKIVEVGSHDQLIALNGRYAQLVALQNISADSQT